MKRLFAFALCVFPLLVFLQLEADSVGALTKDYLNSDPNWNHIKDAAILPFMAFGCDRMAAICLSEDARMLLTLLAPLLTIGVGINAAASSGLREHTFRRTRG
jgi:hypothetical protein